MSETRIFGLVSRLKKYSLSRDVYNGEKVHQETIDMAMDTNAYVATSLISMYAKCRRMSEAHRVFDKLPATARCDVVLWTSLILGYAHNGDGYSALRTFSRIGCAPNSRTIVAALKACICIACKEPPTAMNDGLVKQEALENGMALHSLAKKLRCETEIFLSSTLVDMYVKCGSLIDAERAFDRMESRNAVAWTALILGYVEYGLERKGLQVFSRMERDGCPPDSGAVVAALKACSSLVEKEAISDRKHVVLEITMAVHAQAIKFGCDRHPFFVNSLVDGYGKCGSLFDARRVFDMNIHHRYKDVVLWTSLLLAYTEGGKDEPALEIFSSMRASRILPDCKSYAAVLKACGNLAALEVGRGIHTEVLRYHGIERDVVLISSLVDFYGKCGCMAQAEHVFDSAECVWRDVVTWTALIAGYNREAEADKVFELFREMEDQGLRPNNVTLVCFLSACSQAGLLERGKACFEGMKREFGVVPGVEHYQCMVDLLGRRNSLQEGIELARKINGKASLNLWKVLLSASCKWKNVQVGKLAFERVMKLDESFYAEEYKSKNIEPVSLQRAKISTTTERMQSSAGQGSSRTSLDDSLHC